MTKLQVTKQIRFFRRFSKNRDQSLIPGFTTQRFYFSWDFRVKYSKPYMTIAKLLLCKHCIFMINMIILNLKRKRGCELRIETNKYVLEKEKHHFL